MEAMWKPDNGKQRDGLVLSILQSSATLMPPPTEPNMTTSIMPSSAITANNAQELQAYQHDREASFEVFRNTLPDPNLELAFQMLSDFSIFPTLPSELRLKIWRLMFPKGRLVWIDWGTSPLKAQRPPPITNSINQESRLETLKDYTLLSYHPASQRGTYWNKDRDILRVCLVAFIAFIGYAGWPQGDYGVGVLEMPFLSPFLNEDTKSIDCVQILEIRIHHEAFVKHFAMLEKIQDRLAVIFQKFEGLKQLRMVIKQPKNGDTVLDTNDLGKEIIRWMAEIFDCVQKKHPAFCIPKISISSLT